MANSAALKQPICVEEGADIDRLIETVASYRELVSEYPMTMIYRQLLEAAEYDLKQAERKQLPVEA